MSEKTGTRNPKDPSNEFLEILDTRSISSNNHGWTFLKHSIADPDLSKQNNGDFVYNLESTVFQNMSDILVIWEHRLQKHIQCVFCRKENFES